MKLNLTKLFIVLSFAGLTLISCNSSSSSRPSTDSIEIASSPEPQTPGTPISAPWKLNLSSEAEEISALLDKRSYTAADTLFNNYIPRIPNDGGIYCQYVRFLLENYDFSPTGYISTPIKTDDKYLVVGVADQAIKLAIEFEPEAKSYLAEVILNSLYNEAYNYANQCEGYIRSVSEITGGTNLIRYAWTAIDLDPGVGKKWATKFASLVPLFVKNGKATSAMWTANLAGDLASATNGDVDFENATNAFRSAIEARNSKLEIIKQASDIYFDVFEDDCNKALKKGDSGYLRFVRTLKDSGIDLKGYEDKGVLP